MEQARMKKVMIIATVILVLAVLLVPVTVRLKDGGTVEYRAVLYTVSDVHRLAADVDGEQDFEEGTIIKIFGKEVFNNVK